MSKYDGRSFVHFTEKEGLADNSVGAIVEDSNGNLWFGTGGGLSAFDGESFGHFTEKEGLADRVVTSILQDKSGNLWVGGNGLTSFIFDNGYTSNPGNLRYGKTGEEKNKSATIRRYAKSDGLKDMSFLSESVELDSKTASGGAVSKALPCSI